MAIPARYQQIVQIWQQLPLDYSEKDLELNFIQKMFESLRIPTQNIKADTHLGKSSGLIADRLIYANLAQPPVLVVEVKKRISALAKAASDDDFLELCHKPNSLYRLAVGYPEIHGNNGICQYLNKSNLNIHPNRLASYGLVINGDFFQLWRRVDGLVLPLTPIQRMTADSIPKLMQQLEHCFKAPKRALITAIWNRKGGVAKTTNTINLGSVLALRGKKVLLIDFDTQTDLTRTFKTDLTRTLELESKDYANKLSDCLTKIQIGDLDAAKTLLNAQIKPRTYKTSDKQSFTVDVLPGEANTLKRLRDDTNTYDLKTKIKLVRKALGLVIEDYDYIFIDVSPASDDLTRTTLFCCDTLLIPLDYSKKALYHAVDLYQRDVRSIRSSRAKQSKLYVGPWNLGLVFSNCPSGVTLNSQLEKCIQDELTARGFTGKQCKTRLSIYAQTKIAEYRSRPVICWQNSPIARLYDDLADEIFLGKTRDNFLND